MKILQSWKKYLWRYCVISLNVWMHSCILGISNWARDFDTKLWFYNRKSCKKYDLRRLAEVSSRIFSSNSFKYCNARKKFLRATFDHFWRYSSCHLEIWANFFVAILFGNFLCCNLLNQWHLYKYNKMSKFTKGELP